MLRAIGRSHGEAVGVVGAARKLTMGAVHGVGPYARRIDGETAVAIAAGHAGLHGEGGRAVHVGGAQGSPGALRHVGLAQAGTGRAGDHRCFVGVGDGDPQFFKHRSGQPECCERVRGRAILTAGALVICQKDQVIGHVGLHRSAHPFGAGHHQVQSVDAGGTGKHAKGACVACDVVADQVVAGTGRDRVVTDTGVNHRATRAGGDGVIASSAGGDVTDARARGDGVVAITRQHVADTCAGRDGAVAHARGHGAVARVGGDGLVARARGHGAVARAGGDGLIARTRGNGVVPRAGGDGAVAHAGGDRTVARARGDGVVSAHAVDGVISCRCSVSIVSRSQINGNLCGHGRARMGVR